MDVLRILADRKAELEAFAQVLDNSNTNNSNSTDGSHPYRRPASANVPISRVIHEERTRAKRSRDYSTATTASSSSPLAYSHVIAKELSTGGSLHGVNPASAAGQKKIRAKLVRLGIKESYRRGLSLSSWKGLQKRRQRMGASRRPVALRRRVRRQLALRYGTRTHPCVCCDAETKKGLDAGTIVKRPAAPQVWLPSHQRMCKRFLFQCNKVRIANHLVHSSMLGEASSRSSTVVRVAVPVKSQRKQHRTLQRWIGHLMPKQQRASASASASGKLPPVSLIADHSSRCTYSIESRSSGGLGDDAAVMLQMLNMSLGTPSSQIGYCWPAGGSSELCEESSNTFSVHHGHMRSDKRGSAPTVVPVTLLMLRPGSFMLVATVPVAISGRVREKCAVQLVSHWSPCTSHAAAGSVSLFEWWCAAAAAHESAPTAAVPMVPLAAHAALRHVSRYRERPPRVVGKKNKKKSQGSQKAKAARVDSALQHHGSLFVFPSFAPHVMAVENQTRLPGAVWSVLLLHAPASSGTQVYNNASLRRAHYSCARLLFGALIAAGRGVEDADDDVSVACRGALSKCLPVIKVPRGYRRGVRSIGLEDCRTLLQLVGRPAFPHDYGHLRGGIHIATVEGEAGRESSFLSYNSVVSRHGSIANAHARVVLRSRHAGRRLPGAYAVPGTVLLRVVRGEGNSSLSISRVGVVTSEALFWQRLGCDVVQVWCCYTSDTDALLSAARDGTTVFVLSSATHSQELISLCEGTPTSARKKQRRESSPAVQQKNSLEGLLCDEDWCTPVEVLPLYL